MPRRLRGEGGGEEYIPFAVRAPRGAPTAKICFLLPTASYMAYANTNMSTNMGAAQILAGRLTVLNEKNLQRSEHREYGTSLYDSHIDGSGICYSSRLRPDPELPPQGAGVDRRHRIHALAVQRGHAPHRVAGGQGLRVRRRHRRGPALRGPCRDPGLHRGPHRLAPGVPLQVHVGCDVRLPAARRAAHVHGRQRLVLAHRLPHRGAGLHRGAPRRGRHPHLDRASRRVLPQLHRRVRRPLAAQRPARRR